MTQEQETFSQLVRKGANELAAGQLIEAQKLFQDAHAINAYNANVNYYLAFIAEEKEDLEEACTYYRAAIDQDPSMRQAYVQLANLLNILGRKLEALLVLRQAEGHFPQDHEIMFWRGQLASRSLPGWHLPMLADQRRNDAFEQAIKAVVKPGDVVLDIGTGSGLLALMAAREGAKHVYACESEPVVAELAREIVALNGFTHKVTILEKHSTDLVIGEDLPEKVDVMITEIFDRAVVGEGALPTINHAWRELMKPDARSLPIRAVLYGVLTECPHLHRFHHIETSNGFDLSPMNILAQPLTYKDAMLGLEESEDHRVLSETFVIQDFDFTTAPALRFRNRQDVEIKKAGTADSVLMWFELHLTDDIVFSTQQPKLHNHWRHASQILLETQDCNVGDKLNLRTDYHGFFDFKLTKA